MKAKLSILIGKTGPTFLATFDLFKIKCRFCIYVNIVNVAQIKYKCRFLFYYK